MRVVFMGTPEYATKILESLLEHHEGVGVFTRQDKKASRKLDFNLPHVKEFLSKTDVPIFQPKSLKDEQAQNVIRELKPDVIVVAAYGQILPQEVLDIATCINLHASILPKYRGASPIQSAILNKEEFTGVTAMRMERGLDTGDMLGFSFVKIDDSTRVEKLFEELSSVASKLTLKVLKNLGKIKTLKQCDALSSYAPKISKSDGLVNFSMSADEIFRKFQALSPWPAIYLESGLKLIEIEKVNIETESGKIAKIEENGVVVGCSVGALKIKTVHAPSKKAVSANEYILGKRVSIGDNFS